MKNIWKWVLGIVIVLAVLAGLFALGFVWRQNRMAAAATVQKVVPNSRMWNGPTAPDGAPRRLVPPRFGPMMGMRRFGRGFGPGPMFFGFFGRLVPIVLLLLLLYAAYRFGKGKAPVAAPAALAPPVISTSSTRSSAA